MEDEYESLQGESPNDRNARHIFTGGFFRGAIESAEVEISLSADTKNWTDLTPLNQKKKVSLYGRSDTFNFSNGFGNHPILIHFFANNNEAPIFANELGDRVIGRAETIPQNSGEPLIEINIPVSFSMLNDWVHVAERIGQSRIERLPVSIGFLGIDDKHKIPEKEQIAFWITYLTFTDVSAAWPEEKKTKEEHNNMKFSEALDPLIRENVRGNMQNVGELKEINNSINDASRNILNSINAMSNKTSQDWIYKLIIIALLIAMFMG